MSKTTYIKVDFSIRQYEGKEEVLRDYHVEVSGGFDRPVWSNMQFHGRQPTARHLELIAEIGARVEELSKLED